MVRDRMQRQRFELKYLLNETTALNLRDFVQSHLEFDEASVGKPNYSYRVNSLYLDSERLYTFWDWVNSNRNRFKLRIRFYDSKPETPAFLEIKRRVHGCILKQRCAIRKSAAQMVLDGQIPTPDDVFSREPKHIVALEAFTTLVTRLHAQPKAQVTYLREAYVAPDNDDVRVTMDREVRIAPCSKLDFGLNYNEYVQPFGDRVILELKFNNRFPNWFTHMIHRFGLTRGAAAKYCEGMASLNHPQQGNWQGKLIHASITESRVSGPPVPRDEFAMPQREVGAKEAKLAQKLGSY